MATPQEKKPTLRGEVMTRRVFLGRLAGLAAAVGTASLAASPLAALSGCSVGTDRRRRLTIVHSNDVHSHIDPFPPNDPYYPGLGGYARRQALINSLREADGADNTLVVDSGDIFQGSPYFNLYQGRLEIALMNEMHVDAVTIGNHEFDNGLQLLGARIREANFPFVNSNYDFGGTPCEGLTKPTLIVERGGLRVGLFGLGVEMAGLVQEDKCHGVGYLAPVPIANDLAARLRHEGCDMVIAVTHIGLSSEGVCDVSLAQQTRGIDVILGGHSHTLMPTPRLVPDLNGRMVVITQSGYGGVATGVLRFEETLSEGGQTARAMRLMEAQSERMGDNWDRS